MPLLAVATHTYRVRHHTPHDCSVINEIEAASMAEAEDLAWAIHCDGCPGWERTCEGDTTLAIFDYQPTEGDCLACREANDYPDDEPDDLCMDCPYTEHISVELEDD